MRSDHTCSLCLCSDGAASLGKVNVEMLERKVGTLEEENFSLRLEVHVHLSITVLHSVRT